MDDVNEEFDRRIDNVFFPKHWNTEEGVEPPNKVSKLNAKKICKILFRNYNLKIDRIAATKEEGIYLVKNDTKSISLIIEAYNDGDVGLIINNNKLKEVVFNEDIENFNFEKAINFFNCMNKLDY